MAYRLNCPCGEIVYGRDEADMVERGTRHAVEAHERHYEPEQVMFLAVQIPDSFLPSDF